MIYLRSDDVFLFQGDSITHGGRVQSDTDLNHVMGHGYQDTCAQRMALDNIERNPVILNRAESGDNIQKLTARAQRDIFSLSPTIFSILDGDNEASSFVDGRSNITNEMFNTMFRDLLDELRRRFPNIRLIIGQPFRYVYEGSGNLEREKRIVELAAANIETVEKIARDYDATFIRYRDVFDKYLKLYPLERLIWDGDHPTFLGHGIMADCFMETVSRDFGA